MLDAYCEVLVVSVYKSTYLISKACTYRGLNRVTWNYIKDSNSLEVKARHIWGGIPYPWNIVYKKKKHLRVTTV